MVARILTALLLGYFNSNSVLEKKITTLACHEDLRPLLFRGFQILRLWASTQTKLGKASCCIAEKNTRATKQSMLFALLLCSSDAFKMT